MEPEFSQEEYKSRVGRIQRSLAGSAIAGLLIVDEVNYRYVTGHYTEAWKNPSRRRGCWITPAGNPVVLVAPGEAGDAQAPNRRQGSSSTVDPALGRSWSATIRSSVSRPTSRPRSSIPGASLDWTASRISRWRWAAA